MRFSKRILALCDAVSTGESVADIGTDHGYVPLILYKQGKSPKVIMSDISEGSLAKAKESFALCGVSLSDDYFRVGDGLKTIEDGEVDCVIIGGLGGNTIAAIIADDLAKTRTFKKLILQPRNNSGELRWFLHTNGFKIICEDLACEGKFICEIITAIPADACGMPEDFVRGDIRWAFPEAFRECDRELLRDKILRKIESMQTEIKNLRKSADDQSERISGLRADIEYLIGLLK